MVGRIDLIQPRADEGHGGEMAGCRSLERALVRCAVHPQCQAGNDGQPCCAERAGELPCIHRALGRRVAAADDGDGVGRSGLCRSGDVVGRGLAVAGDYKTATRGVGSKRLAGPARRIPGYAFLWARNPRTRIQSIRNEAPTAPR